jgi:hypothetical protein
LVDLFSSLHKSMDLLNTEWPPGNTATPLLWGPGTHEIIQSALCSGRQDVAALFQKAWTGRYFAVPLTPRWQDNNASHRQLMEGRTTHFVPVPTETGRPALEAFAVMPPYLSNVLHTRESLAQARPPKHCMCPQHRCPLPPVLHGDAAGPLCVACRPCTNVIDCPPGSDFPGAKAFCRRRHIFADAHEQATYTISVWHRAPHCALVCSEKSCACNCDGVAAHGLPATTAPSEVTCVCTRCYHCGKKTAASITCTSCAAPYCSAECRAEAAEDHERLGYCAYYCTNPEWHSRTFRRPMTRRDRTLAGMRTHTGPHNRLRTQVQQWRLEYLQQYPLVANIATLMRDMARNTPGNCPLRSPHL